MIFKILISMILMSPTMAKTELAANVEVQYGKSWASDQMYGKLDTGDSWRLKLFGGAKLPKIKFLSAVGLGFDFTYTSFANKSGAQGFRYDRYTWDMFYVPIRIWIFRFTPGISWVVTSVKDAELGINEKSIRPGFTGSAGIGIPIGPLEFIFDMRSEYVMEDRERTADGRNVNITGSFLTAYGGLGLSF